MNPDKISCKHCSGSGREYSFSQMQVFPCDWCGGYGYTIDFDETVQKGNRMNYSTAVMLINENIRAILCSYETDKDGNGVKPFTMYKTLDHSMKIGEFVVVPTNTRHKMTVCKVEAVDVDVDDEDPTHVDWVVGKISLVEHDTIKSEENKWIIELKESEKRAKKEEIKNKMFDMYKDVPINQMRIASMSDVAPEAEAIEQK